MLIAGDIGGTKSHLVAYDESGGKLRVVARKRYATRDFSSFEKLVEEFARHAAGSSAPNRITGAGFGVPGTVVDGRLHAAHVPWVLDSASLAASLGLPRKHIVLMNDLVATARGLQKLEPEDLLYLNRGVDHPEENRNFSPVAVFALFTNFSRPIFATIPSANPPANPRRKSLKMHWLVLAPPAPRLSISGPMPSARSRAISRFAFLPTAASISPAASP